MSPDEILELELKLFLIKYGEKKILTSLAKLIGISPSELENKVQKVHQVGKKTVKEKGNRLSRVIEEIIEQHPQKARLLRKLYDQFQDRSFLPETHDIKRLLHRYELKSDGLKSRDSSAPKVFKLLASLEENELEELVQLHKNSNFSSLGIISDEIMRHQV